MSENHRVSINAPNIAHQIDVIISCLSLTISQTAQVLTTNRPMVYYWKKLEEFCNTEDPKHQRLMIIYDLAIYWSNLNLGPMGDRNLLPFEDDKKSIIKYLSSEKLTDELVEKIKQRMEVLAKPKEYPNLLIPKGTNWRQAFKNMGIQGPSLEQQDSIQDDNLKNIRNEY